MGDGELKATPIHQDLKLTILLAKTSLSKDAWFKKSHQGMEAFKETDEDCLKRPPPAIKGSFITLVPGHW
ncbi:hypothetical protein BG003_000913 [Podila horticola]|nr:hypothetical protein BG003_000913 [Podila horticola]